MERLPRSNASWLLRWKSSVAVLTRCRLSAAAANAAAVSSFAVSRNVAVSSTLSPEVESSVVAQRLVVGRQRSQWGFLAAALPDWRRVLQWWRRGRQCCLYLRLRFRLLPFERRLLHRRQRHGRIARDRDLFAFDVGSDPRRQHGDERRHDAFDVRVVDLPQRRLLEPGQLGKERERGADLTRLPADEMIELDRLDGDGIDLLLDELDGDEQLDAPSAVARPGLAHDLASPDRNGRDAQDAVDVGVAIDAAHPAGVEEEIPIVHFGGVEIELVVRDTADRIFPMLERAARPVGRIGAPEASAHDRLGFIGKTAAAIADHAVGGEHVLPHGPRSDHGRDLRRPAREHEGGFEPLQDGVDLDRERRTAGLVVDEVLLDIRELQLRNREVLRERWIDVAAEDVRGLHQVDILRHGNVLRKSRRM